MNQRSLIFFALLAGTFAPGALYGQATDFHARSLQRKEEARKAEEARRQGKKSDNPAASAAADDNTFFEPEETIEEQQAALWDKVKGRQGRNSEVSPAAGRQAGRANSEASAAASNDGIFVPPEETFLPRRTRDEEPPSRQAPRASAVDSASPSDGGISVSKEAIDLQERLLREAKAGRQESRARVVDSASPLNEGPPQADEQKGVKAPSEERRLEPPPAPPLPVTSLAGGPMRLGPPAAPPVPVATGTAGQMRLRPPRSSSAESDDDSGPEHSVNSGSGEDVRREIASLAKEMKRLQEQIAEIRASGGGPAGGGGAAAGGSSRRERPVVEDARRSENLVEELHKAFERKANRLAALEQGLKRG